MRPLIVFTLFACGALGAGDLYCPPRIEVAQRLSLLVPGWSAASDKMPHQLAGITFFDGKPEEGASLVPDKRTRTSATWTFAATGRPVWLACSYSGTDIVLRRELPKTIKTCSITYSARDTVAGLPVVEKVDCK